MFPLILAPLPVLPLNDQVGVDYVDDDELTHAERALLATYTTARIGHNHRRCWPLSEVVGDG